MEREKTIDTILYLLGLNTIDYWIRKWREEEVDIAHDNMNYMWHIFTKSMYESQSYNSDIKNQNTANMRHTSI